MKNYGVSISTADLSTFAIKDNQDFLEVADEIIVSYDNMNKI